MIYTTLSRLILRLLNGEALGDGRKLRVTDDQDRWFELGPVTRISLAEFDVLLMRKDPPFDTEYILHNLYSGTGGRKGSASGQSPG